MGNTSHHSFHIPVMGLGYTVDTPIKIAHFGINSVLSIGDDHLLEKIRKFYCQENYFPYTPIKNSDPNRREKRITAYLNLAQKIVETKFEKLKQEKFEKGTNITKYFEMLNPNSFLYVCYQSMLEEKNPEAKSNIQELLRKNMICGSIDVNIMSKVDNPTFHKKEQLPPIYNDAMSALRGFALSNLSSSIVISAGLNPRLFSYFSEFEDFKYQSNGTSKKKIILKVSDYRSALIQGKFLAKKGIWPSEFRIESGLNCGGHAFATQGELMGFILEQFKSKRNELIQEIFEVYSNSLKENNQEIPSNPFPILFSAQGGVGTHEEHQFLINEYNLDSIGWGTPFLLVPEAISIDKETITLLANSKEEDVYTSQISPLGVPFNTIKGNTLEKNMLEQVENNQPGSKCPKQFLAFNTEFSSTPLCIASKHYMKLKIESINNSDIDSIQKEKEIDKVLEKTCLCSGLGTSTLIDKGIDIKHEVNGVAICPGPNIAYFDREYSLKEIVDHIYGKTNLINNKFRPHFLIKEAGMYKNHFLTQLENSTQKQKDNFINAYSNGLNYYLELFKNNQAIIEEIHKQELISEKL